MSRHCKRSGARRAWALSSGGGRALLALPIGIAAALCLVACGSSARRAAHVHTTHSESTLAEHTFSAPGAAPSGAPHLATIRLSSAAPYIGGGIAPRYTCHGEDISPPIKWHNLAEAAPQAKELMLFVRTIAHGKVEVDWGLAGLSPKLAEVKAGQTPPGAIVARNSSGSVGYRLCPPAGALMTFALYALPQRHPLKQGFDPESVRALLEAGSTQWGGMTF